MALAYSLSSIINCAILLIVLNKKLKGLELKSLVQYCVKLIAASLVMGALLICINKYIPVDFARAFSIKDKIYELLYLFAEIALGASVYFAVALLIKVEELRYIIDLIKRKLKSVHFNY